MSMPGRTGVRSTHPDAESPAVAQQDHESKVAGVVRETVPAAPRRQIGSLVRILFGLIWGIDAYFKWQPSFQQHLEGVISGGAKGQPGFLAPWFDFAKGAVAIDPTLWAYGTALAETGLAIVLLLGLARKVTYIGGAVYSLLIWATAEGLGRTSGVATDIGTAIIYSVVFLALLALDMRGKGTRPYSLDAVIERRVPWWRGLAEVGR